MKIVFFIGNGFDLSLGLKTRYLDFYEYYKNVNSDSNNIEKLKEDIDKNFQNWSDLELELGRYTKNIHSLDELDEISEDIATGLANYLHKEEVDFKVNEDSRKRILEWLSLPELFLLPSDRDRVTKYRGLFANRQWNTSIITLNYTRVIDNVLSMKVGEDLFIGNNYSGYSIVVNRLEHLHGYVDDRIILGVNDASQVSNEEFHRNKHFLQSIVKPKANEACRHNIDRICMDQIESANLICIYGCSLGLTDTLWWQLIAERLKNDCMLIIFYRQENLNQLFFRKITRHIEAVEDMFLDKSNFSQEEKENLREKIFVCINADIHSKAR